MGRGSNASKRGDDFERVRLVRVLGVKASREKLVAFVCDKQLEGKIDNFPSQEVLDFPGHPTMMSIH